MKQFLFLFFYLLLNYVSLGSFQMMRRHGFDTFSPVVDSSLNSPQSDIPFMEFDQIYDHYDPGNVQRTFKQTYQVSVNSSEQGAQSDRPVFLFILGNEPKDYHNWYDTTAVKYYAKQYGALVFGLEHRGFGWSNPNGRTGVYNLTILTIDQALADVAYFIEGMNIKYNLTEKNKWIVFGRKYGGSLAAWARLKYPHLIHAAVSSSAPLLAKVDFPEFVDFTRQYLSAHNEFCGKTYHDANVEFRKLLKTPEGRVKIQQYFALLCSFTDLTNEMNAQTFAYSKLVYFNKIGYCDQCSDDLNKMCDALTNKTLGSPLQRFAVATKNWYNSCGDALFQENVLLRKEIFYWLIWGYIQATQLGMYSTSENESSGFGPTLPLSFYEKFNMAVYGERYNLEFTTKAVRQTNLKYGGLNIKVDRVVFVHGSLDPYYVLGITKSTNPNSPAIFINGSGSSVEMKYPGPYDLPQVKQARKEINELIGKWLKVEY